MTKPLTVEAPDSLEHFRAIAAVANLASFFRDIPDDCFWEPRFRVKPTHSAIYRDPRGDFSSTEHVEDVPLSEMDAYHDRLYEQSPDEYDDYFAIQYDEITGAAEWVPGIGPAPIWSHPDAAITLTRLEMARLVAAFVRLHWLGEETP